MAKPQPPSNEELALHESQTLLQQWLRVRAFFAKAMDDSQISREDENAFLETKTEVSRLTRTLASRCPEWITFGDEKIAEMLKQCISIGHLRAMPESDRKAQLSLWHQLFVSLSQTMGTFQFINEGFDPGPRKKKVSGMQLSDLKGAADSNPKKKPSKIKEMLSGRNIFILILLGVAAYMLFFRNR